MSLSLKTTDMHTGGQSVRIVESGLPEIEGVTLLEKQKYFSDKLNHIRRFLFYEPRGHENLIGIIIVPSDAYGADFACMVLYKETYLPMCGDAIIAAGRFAVDRGIVVKTSGSEVKVVIQLSSGLIETFVNIENGHAGSVRFTNVPSFVYAQDVVADVPGYGPVMVDISYGGNLYVVLSAERLGLDVKTSTTQELVRAADSISDVIKKTVQLWHPILGLPVDLLGTILTDGRDEYSPNETSHISVVSGGQVCRSPSGSTTSARVALQVMRGLLHLKQTRSFCGPSNSEFQAKAVRHTSCGQYDAVVEEITGKSHYTGSSSFMIEDDDEIGQGFFLF